MPRDPKLYIPRGVHFITFRTESGLPFVAADHVKLILEGILARATERFDVTLCHYIWLANHVHMLVVVHDPEQIANFLGFIKTESAHAVNRMLGIRKRTVWESGCDSPVVLTAQSAIEKIAYIYANPAKANLVDRIEDYPMLSSWEMFATRLHTKRCPIISRNQLRPLGTTHLSLRHQGAYCNSLAAGSIAKAILKLQPHAWMRCYPELTGLTTLDADQLVLSRLRELEGDARHQRSKPVLGELALRTEDIKQDYSPDRHGRRSLCISSDIPTRQQFLDFAKCLFRLARDVFQEWRSGNYSRKYPPGLFSPRPPRLANLLSPL